MPSEFSLENLPELIREHINKPSLSDKYIALFSEISLEQTRPLNKLIWQVYHREISLVDFLQKAQALNLPQFNEKIFPSILAFDFFPIADYLRIDISEWSKYLSKKESAELKIVSLADWRDKYLEEEGLTLDDDAKNRLGNILEEYLSGKKDKNETKNFLMHAEKIGGANMEEEEAKRITEEFKKRIQDAWEKDEILTAQKLPIKEAPLPTQESHPLKKQSDKGLLREMSQPTIPPLPTIQIYGQAAKEIIEMSGIKVAIDLEPRFKSILVSGLKEVRKIIEVRERLAADPKIGGLGLNPEEVEKILQLIEEGKKKIAGGQTFIKPQALVSSVIPTRLPDRQADPAKGGGVEGSRDPSNPPAGGLGMTKNEAWMTKDEDKEVKKELPLSSVIKPSIKKEEPKLEDLVMQATLPAEERRIPPPPPIAPAPAPIPRIKEAPRPSKIATSSDIKIGQAPAIKIVSQKKNETKVELSSVPPLPPKPLVTNAVPQTPQGRAKIEDVKFRLRLIGPIEELQEMTLLDFHRLSPKPKVALDKIRAKIELLEKEGYAKRILGIQSWQKSPLNQMYLSLLNEGIKKGLPIKQLLEEKRKTNQEILTVEEFQEIMEFNRSLRF